MKGITGKLATGVYVEFEVWLTDTKTTDRNKRFPIVKGSKTNEKGACLPFDNDEKEARIYYKTLVDNIEFHITEVKTMPRSRIYVKLPSSGDLAISEFFLEGYLQIDKINIVSKNKSIEGNALHAKLKENKKVTIDSKVYIEQIGPALIVEEEHETEYGAIKRIRTSLDVEI